MNDYRPHKIIISASRRTDIPAFYMPWFMGQVRRGTFEVTNPFNQRVSFVPATPDKVDTIVFWSKNFGPFLDKSYGEQLRKQGFHLFFNFTINSDCTNLEPNVPPLKKRLEQLEHLCQRFGPKTINWRFDPLCFFKTGVGRLQDNLHGFPDIAEKAAEFGIVRCITSFMDHYPKIRRRLSNRPGFAFIDLPLKRKLKSWGEWKKRLPPETYIYPPVAKKTCWRRFPGVRRYPEVPAFPVISSRNYSAAGFLLKKIPVSGSKPVVDVPCRLTSDHTAFNRAITTACFVMRILLPSLAEDDRFQVLGLGFKGYKLLICSSL